MQIQVADSFTACSSKGAATSPRGAIKGARWGRLLQEVKCFIYLAICEGTGPGIGADPGCWPIGLA